MNHLTKQILINRVAWHITGESDYEGNGDRDEPSEAHRRAKDYVEDYEHKVDDGLESHEQIKYNETKRLWNNYYGGDMDSVFEDYLDEIDAETLEQGRFLMEP